MGSKEMSKNEAIKRHEKAIENLVFILNMEFNAASYNEIIDSGYSRVIAERIYNSLEIDRDRVLAIINGEADDCNEVMSYYDLAKAIAGKKPIKIMES